MTVSAERSLRFGRESLAREGKDPDALREARRALARACRADPFLLRPCFCLLWGTVAPSTYHHWRRWELERRD